jgi:hypothetical protein
MSDLTLICQDCSQEFVFTQGEQDFYRQKNLETPRFCLICRGKHQAQTRDRAQYTQNPSSKA